MKIKILNILQLKGKIYKKIRKRNFHYKCKYKLDKGDRFL